VPRTETVMGAVETEVALLLRRAEATRRASAGVAHRALDRAAYVILRRLDETGPSNIGGIAAALGVDASTMTRQVAALERDGLVRRERDPADGRGTVISVTSAGTNRLRSVRKARVDLYEEVLAGWPDTDRQTLATYLRRLNEALDAHARQG
jgi:DNA-binding MarR family transcriptional regulator